MIGIKKITSYIPDNFKSNYLKKQVFRINDDFIVNKIGVEEISVKFPEEDTSDLCVKAYEKMSKFKSDLSKTIDCIVVCTQNPDRNGIPHTSAVLHEKLYLKETCACFDISLGCSGYVHSLSIVSAFMEANNLTSALIFTADPYSKIINPEDKNTALLFGDAATVTFLKKRENKGRFWIPSYFQYLTKGSERNAINNDGEKLSMDGRAVFNFAMKNVPKQIKELLKVANLDISMIDLFLFHQGSKYIVDQLCRYIRIPREKAPVNISNIGNTVSSSIPLLLEDHMPDESVNKMVLCGFGVGLSSVSCLLTKHEK